VKTIRQGWREKSQKLLPSCFSFVIGLGLLDVGPSGCQKSFVAISPVAMVLPADKVFPAAQYYASLRPNAIVVKGEGSGMQPLYRSGTVLVVEAEPYGALREGMSVMFNGEDQTRVVHYLLRRNPEGWTTLGLNQGDIEDDRPMTDKNYIGVVTMAFTPEAPPKAPAP
jgi:hypothetical protein